VRGREEHAHLTCDLNRKVGLHGISVGSFTTESYENAPNDFAMSVCLFALKTPEPLNGFS
jgi:hypothetical protein